MHAPPRQDRRAQQGLAFGVNVARFATIYTILGISSISASKLLAFDAIELSQQVVMETFDLEEGLRKEIERIASEDFHTDQCSSSSSCSIVFRARVCLEVGPPACREPQVSHLCFFGLSMDLIAFLYLF